MRKINFALLAAIVFLCFTVPALATEGTCVFSKQTFSYDGEKRTVRQWLCTGDAATGDLGSASAAAISGAGYDEAVYSAGAIRWVEIEPGTGGSTPSAITGLKLMNASYTAINYLGVIASAASVSAVVSGMPVDSTNYLPIEILGRTLTVQATGLGIGKTVTIRIVTKH